jgi:hypothetical protein
MEREGDREMARERVTGYNGISEPVCYKPGTDHNIYLHEITGLTDIYMLIHTRPGLSSSSQIIWGVSPHQQNTQL